MEWKHTQISQAACANPSLHNSEAVAARISVDYPGRSEAELLQLARQVVNPAIQWFLRKFNVDLGNIVTMFRRVQIFDPVAAQSLQLNDTTIDGLHCIPFLREHINGMKDEQPQYAAAIVDVALDTDDKKVAWWKNQRDIPAWSEAVKKLLLLQPSSAAAERVFSLMKAHFNKCQQSALEETVEASVMLCYYKV